MDKAVLIIDMPKTCNECPCFQFGMDNYCGVTDKVSWDWNTKRLDDCPLKLVSDRRSSLEFINMG